MNHLSREQSLFIKDPWENENNENPKIDVDLPDLLQQNLLIILQCP